eukprot:3776253-Pleurochrysis_carterae.AAC.1
MRTQASRAVACVCRACAHATRGGFDRPPPYLGQRARAAAILMLNVLRVIVCSRASASVWGCAG